MRSEFAYTALSARAATESVPLFHRETDGGTDVASRSAAARLVRDEGPGTSTPQPEPDSETSVRGENALTYGTGAPANGFVLGRRMPPDPDPDEFTHARHEVVRSSMAPTDLSPQGWQGGEEPEEISEARHEVAWWGTRTLDVATETRRHTILGVLASQQTKQSSVEVRS